MSKGNVDAFLKALFQREAGKNVKVINYAGYVGKYQFGESALIDPGHRWHRSSSHGVTMNLLSTKSFTTAKVAYSTAKEHVMPTAQGAYLKLSGGNIEVHGPGAMTFKASHKELIGPASASATLPRLPSGELNLNQSVHHAYAAQYQVLRGEKRVAQQPYLLKLPDGSLLYGKPISKAIPSRSAPGRRNRSS